MGCLRLAVISIGRLHVASRCGRWTTRGDSHRTLKLDEALRRCKVQQSIQSSPSEVDARDSQVRQLLLPMQSELTIEQKDLVSWPA